MRRKILRLVLEGSSNQEIANRFNLGEQEVQTELSDTIRDLGLCSRVELLLLACSSPVDTPGRENLQQLRDILEPRVSDAANSHAEKESAA